MNPAPPVMSIRMILSGNAVAFGVGRNEMLNVGYYSKASAMRETSFLPRGSIPHAPSTIGAIHRYPLQSWHDGF
jgi:hypothetical protein